MDLASLVFLAVVSAGLLGAFAWQTARSRRREARDAAAHARSIEEARHIPPSLHPVIDPNLCIGSLACISACPEGDILGIVRGSAAMIDAGACIGHGRCAVECPVGAIKLVFGDSERGVDLPEVDESFESSRPGVFVVGELGGMGLIKNAITQGLEVAAYLDRTLGPKTDVTDVVIAGAGPAGLATAAALVHAGRSVRVVDQQVSGGSIAHYPRQKLVMTERARIPGYGAFGQSRMTKEELLAELRKVQRRFGLTVEEGVRVTGIDGASDAFAVRTDPGASIACRRVVLAVGRRGSPRTLRVPGEESARVTYALTDARQYDGQRVLVVGGGDAAAEAATQLARDSSAVVDVACRGPLFARARLANRSAVAEQLAAGKLRAHANAEVLRIEEGVVVLGGEGGEQALPNDFVIACLGGETPLELLQAVKVDLVRHRGDQAMPPPTRRTHRDHDRDGVWSRLGRGLVLGCGAGAALLALALIYAGHEYYLLPRAERIASPLHDLWRSAGPLGNTIGWAATLLMLTNFAYAVRKRWSRLHGLGPLRRWMSAHVFVGLYSPLIVAIHAAFQANNTVALTTYVSLLVVVGTGLVGRYVYGLIPAVDGRRLEESEVAARVERRLADAQALAQRSANPARAVALLRAAGQGEADASWAQVFALPFAMSGAFVRAGGVPFAAAADRRLFRREAAGLVRARAELRLFALLRGFLGWWRVLHVVLAVLLVLLMALHIGVSIYLGYGWVT